MTTPRPRFLAYLTGCTKSIHIGSKMDMINAITHLATCDVHAGQHHFAITGEGTTLSMSPTAGECLRKVGLLPPWILE